MTFPDKLTELLEKAKHEPQSSIHPGLELWVLLRNNAEAIRDLVVAVKKHAQHRECEDSWYSCPKSENGCADERETECNCGADELIKALAKLEEA